MHFDGDAFISYAHLDNQELVEGRKGWVANLHRALEIRVGQLLGKRAQIWRDPKLAGNDLFAETLAEQLRRVAVLISVVSPRYVKSDWAQRELAEFYKAADGQGGIRVRDKARVFKVLKTPVPLEATPPELRSLLGYEFFRIDPETGKVRELDEVFGPEAEREFWMKLDDLAHDIGDLLQTLEGPNLDDAPAERGAVFLAETTSDLREERQAIRRDLQQHGYVVLPAEPLPLVDEEIRAAIRTDMARCQMSIHLVGRHYSLVPEGATESVIEIQNELAIERSEQGGASRVVWIPAGLEVANDRQRLVVESFRKDPRIRNGDLLETQFEDLRTAVHQWLTRDQQPVAAAPPATAAAGEVPRLYLIHDQRDSETVGPWADFLFDQHLEVLRPLFQGDEADIREDHEDNLRTCDGVVVIFGAGNECWLRRKLRELQKSAGYGRVKPAPPVAIALVPPRTDEKDHLRTHEAAVIPQWEGFQPEAFTEFVARLKGAGRQG
jgi:TIR domain/Domain of unknown function (DUF4062)